MRDDNGFRPAVVDRRAASGATDAPPAPVLPMSANENTDPQPRAANEPEVVAALSVVRVRLPSGEVRTRVSPAGQGRVPSGHEVLGMLAEAVELMRLDIGAMTLRASLVPQGPPPVAVPMPNVRDLMRGPK